MEIVLCDLKGPQKTIPPTSDQKSHGTYLLFHTDVGKMKPRVHLKEETETKFKLLHDCVLPIISAQQVISSLKEKLVISGDTIAFPGMKMSCPGQTLTVLKPWKLPWPRK
jgi:hypothetical protein